MKNPFDRWRHRQLKELLSSYIDGQVTSGERDRVERHLAGCDECRQDLESLRLTVTALRGLPEIQTLRSFAVQTPPEPTPAEYRWIPSMRIAGSFAAVVVVGIAVVTVAGVLIQSGDSGEEGSFARLESTEETVAAPAAPAALQVPAQPPPASARAAPTQAAPTPASVRPSAPAAPEAVPAVAAQAVPVEAPSRPAAAAPAPAAAPVQVEQITAQAAAPAPVAQESAPISGLTPETAPTAAPTTVEAVTGAVVTQAEADIVTLTRESEALVKVAEDTRTAAPPALSGGLPEQDVSPATTAAMAESEAAATTPGVDDQYAIAPDAEASTATPATAGTVATAQIVEKEVEQPVQPSVPTATPRTPETSIPTPESTPVAMPTLTPVNTPEPEPTQTPVPSTARSEATAESQEPAAETTQAAEPVEADAGTSPAIVLAIVLGGVLMVVAVVWLWTSRVRRG